MIQYNIIKKVVDANCIENKGYRFFFFSREELRQHIHVQCQNGEAKFWLDPQIELAKNYKLSQKELKEVETIIEEHHKDFINAWEEHFGS